MEEAESQQSQQSQRRQEKQLDEDDSYTEATSSTFEKHNIGAMEREALVGNLMRLALFHDCSKTPLKKADIQALIMGEYGKKRSLTNEVIAEAGKRFKETFGYDFVELTTVRKNKKGSTVKKNAPTGLFILVNGVKDDKEMLSWTAEAPQFGLLMTILSIIYMSDGAVEEVTLFQLLGSLGLSSRDLRHPLFGDWQELISKTFTKQYYLKRRPMASKKGSHEYAMGPRATLEITKLQILEFVASVFGDELDEIQKQELADAESDSDEQMADN